MTTPDGTDHLARSWNRMRETIRDLVALNPWIPDLAHIKLSLDDRMTSPLLASDIRALLRSVSAAPQPPAEPVAWRITDGAAVFCTTRETNAEGAARDGLAVQPLYLAPPDARRKALEEAARFCRENASQVKIVMPLTNAAYDEGCRDCAAGIEAMMSGAPAEPAGDDLATQRHDCAASGRHDHDGCSCTDDELRARQGDDLAEAVRRGRAHSDWLRQRAAMQSDNHYEPSRTFSAIADWIDQALARHPSEQGRQG